MRRPCRGDSVPGSSETRPKPARAGTRPRGGREQQDSPAGNGNSVDLRPLASVAIFPAALIDGMRRWLKAAFASGAARMQAYDILMLIVLGLAIVWGAWKGLAWQIASIASIGTELLRGPHFRLAAGRNLINASPPWNIFLSMLILFLGTGLIVWIGFNLVQRDHRAGQAQGVRPAARRALRRGQGRAAVRADYAVFGRALRRCPAAGDLQLEVGLLHRRCCSTGPTW